MYDVDPVNFFIDPDELAQFIELVDAGILRDVTVKLVGGDSDE